MIICKRTCGSLRLVFGKWILLGNVTECFATNSFELLPITRFAKNAIRFSDALEAA